jgi:hypothetical protein
LGERGGLNVYTMVGNDPINDLDYLGKYALPLWLRPFLWTMGSNQFGEELLENWIYGAGTFNRFDDPSWSSYMKASSTLRVGTLNELGGILYDLPIGKSRLNESQIPIVGIADDNSFSGYSLLNGPNANYGGFEIRGTILKCPHPDGYGKTTVEGDLWFTFNDYTDENGFPDIVRSWTTRVLTGFMPRNHLTKITWKSKIDGDLFSTGYLTGSGWPISSQ